jgi:hypothetical protein
MADKKVRSRKFILVARNDTNIDKVQISILNFLDVDSELYITQYAKNSSVFDLGNYDIVKNGNSAVLSFYPIDDKPNDYSTCYISYDTKKDYLTYNSYDLGNTANVGSYHTSIGSTGTSLIAQIPKKYTSTKLLLSISGSTTHQYEELNIIHNNSEVFIEPYSRLSNVEDGLGQYTASVDNNFLYLNFSPYSTSETQFNVNYSNVSLANTSFTTTGYKKYRQAYTSTILTNIAASANPTEIAVASYGAGFAGGYYIVQVTDNTNSRIEMYEILLTSDTLESYMVVYGILRSDVPLGEFKSVKSTTTELQFKPNKNINVSVLVYQNLLSFTSSFNSPVSIDFGNSEIITFLSRYGYNGDGRYKSDFELFHNSLPIFKREFNGSNSDIVNTTDDTIEIHEHFFVTGEKVNYYPDIEDKTDRSKSIGIAQTTIAGIGLTDKLPLTSYVYKVNDSKIKLCATAQDSLKLPPKVLDLNQLGTFSKHSIVATNQNTKALIEIDNVIQSPIVSTATTTLLTNQIGELDEIIQIQDNIDLAAGELIRIDDEVMKVYSIDGNNLEVIRPVLGSTAGIHTATTLITKLSGNYNISDNTIYFSGPPYGPIPSVDENSSYDQLDYEGIQTKSTFHGRTFMRSGINNTSSDTYASNYLFDDISDKFDVSTNTFTLKQNKVDISGFYNDNSIVLVNSTIQTPEENFYLEASGGGTNIVFSQDALSVLTYDPNTTGFPRGGILVSVGSSTGLGYAPLVCAGGTAIVSAAGTIASISIGNSGSGYRPGIQTSIRVGVKTENSSIFYIGTASVSSGEIISVNITNPGLGYTRTNPPIVIFDDPLSYTNIPLNYAQGYSGFGTGATVDIVVGLGSSVIDFKINRFGYNYKKGDVLTVPITGNQGIVTYSNYSPFKILVDRVYRDGFSGWHNGQIQKLDDISSFCDGFRKSFNLSLNGNRFSILSRKGSNVDVQYTLFIFIDDVLQVPNESYIFKGGSQITFTDAPKLGSAIKILFYRGTKDIDVSDVDIIETIKSGDHINIEDDTRLFDEEERLVYDVLSTNTVETNSYRGPGISNNPNQLRPTTWCKQREDSLVNGKYVSKARVEYNANIHPVAYLTKSIGTATSIFFVDSVKCFFDNKNESTTNFKRSKINIISQNSNTVESVKDVSYQGDFGTIVGIGTTQFIDSYSGLTLDLHIPYDSPLRSSTYNVNPISISGIQTGYRFVVNRTNTGLGNNSYDNSNSIVGFGTTCIDNVYEVIDHTTVSKNVPGVGVTNIKRVFVKVNSYVGVASTNGYSGDYSWGRIITNYRENPKEFSFYSPGISTSAIVRRVYGLNY